ncbi:hypothetical protein DKX38_013731 [Salix brachista]|uniref:Uncharacterized protein n=1 Tax=Salix brachista TaxID=2182728 RepID=A0A5N5LDJ9_9ROSI|nr:hypothetical protein DKX38_013731 [Salix brachista]
MFEDVQYLYQVWKMTNGKRSWGMLIDYAGLCMFMVLDTNTVQVRYVQNATLWKAQIVETRWLEWTEKERRGEKEAHKPQGLHAEHARR